MTSSKPVILLTYDDSGHVFLEVQKYVENNRTKAKQTFNKLANILLAQAKGSLRKRKGSSLYGFYLPVFRFTEVEHEVRELYTLKPQIQRKLEFVQDLLEEITNSWPDEASFDETASLQETEPEE